MEMVAPPEPKSDEHGDLFKREGLYYVRLRCSGFNEPLEIALHGVVSEEQARVASKALFTGSVE
jgi:hypothetical protein